MHNQDTSLINLYVEIHKNKNEIGIQRGTPNIVN